YRGMQNVVQGSRPKFLDAWRKAAVTGNQKAKNLTDSIYAENLQFYNSPVNGIRKILARASAHPWQYAKWYFFEKPRQLWSWDIRYGAGDIYVYPTRNSIFRTQPAMRMVASLCHALNPWLTIFALASFVLVFTRRRNKNPEQHNTIPLLLQATLLLIAYITLIYTVFMAIPRYPI